MLNVLCTWFSIRSHRFLPKYFISTARLNVLLGYCLFETKKKKKLQETPNNAVLVAMVTHADVVASCRPNVLCFYHL